MYKKLKIQVEKLPAKPGVYLFESGDGKIIYVGKSINLKNRVKSYFQSRDILDTKTAQMVAEIKRINYIPVFSEIEALLLEASLIKKHQPKYNIIWKDDKSPLYIKITIGDKIPIVITTRREKETSQVLLFGPFPRASVAKNVLKTIRRIFPYCQHKSMQKSCLWVHLGLCPDPYRGNLRMYRNNIKNIIMLLNGQNKKVLLNLKRQMKLASRREEFEKAARIKKQIEEIQYLTQTYRGPTDYLERPTLYQDLVIEKLKDLAKTLKLSKIPQRIEAIDISNIMGKKASGSLVVFIDGEKDKSQYRRFKIKTKETPDDIAMIKEVLSRRLQNKWPLPDLIVIDGGLGQLNAAINILAEFGKNIPTIALAKREEEIYFKEQKKPLKLSKDSLALQLIQEIRDEAHRFALSYHRKLRAKEFLTKKQSL